MSTRNSDIRAFRKEVWNYWKRNGRHELPWRKTTDPYKILVSEVMLQQTQVSRVQEKYKEFLKRFPTVRSLSKADFVDVLKVWSGLGYNRRGKFLRDAAIVVVDAHKGKIPSDYESLRKLPGIGDYTARAVRIFAFNEPDILIETNTRTALIYHFGGATPIIHDREIWMYAKKAAKGQDPREWHWALMDYGAYLKRCGVRNNARSKHYVKQSKFEGSLRQKRGEILRNLQSGKAFKRNSEYQTALASLAKDGLVVAKKGKWRIA